MNTPTPWEAVIGLEVHVQLATRAKLFAPEARDPSGDASPNTHISPVSLGMPGALPVLNARAVELAVIAGLALGCQINTRSVFARKNYFYPDLPRGYQISQHLHPICGGGGHVEFVGADGATRRCQLTRIHLEEDAGKSIHGGPGGDTLLDFNRAGVALIEIVTEPDLRSASDAAAAMRALHEIVVALGVGEGNMERGQLRCDANVSVRRPGSPLGTRVEIKNLNSFRFVEAAVTFEIARQVALIEGGGAVRQSTRLWESREKVTREMRRKEEAQDYRYFPDPDLPPLVLEDGMVDRLKASLPELPAARRQRYVSALKLSRADARALTSSAALSTLFEAALTRHDDAQGVCNLLLRDALMVLNARGIDADGLPPDTGARLGALASMIERGVINHGTAPAVIELMIDEDTDPMLIVEDHGLKAVRDADAVSLAVSETLAKETDNVARYRKGERRLFGYLMGSVMRTLSGQGDPARVRELLQRALDD